MAIPTVDPARYDEQLAEKQAYVESTFAAFDTPALEVYPPRRYLLGGYSLGGTPWGVLPG